MSTALATRPPATTQSIGTDYGTINVKGRGRNALVLREMPDGRLSARRPRNEQEWEIASRFQWERSILDSPDFWEAASKLPNSAKAKRSKNGRPAAHPDWLYMFIAAVTAVTGSQRSAIGEFLDPVLWKWLREATDNNPYRKALGLAKLGDTPLARHHMNYFLKRWRSAGFAPFADAAKQAALDVARQTAVQLGLFDASQPINFKEPDPGKCVRADATVFKPPSKTKARSAKPGQRVDTASGLHSIGGDAKVIQYGSKIEFFSTRTDDYGSRLIVAYDAVAGATKNGIGNEAAVTMRLVEDLKRQLPGLQLLIVDSVLRGKHIADLAAHDILVVNYPHALANANRSEGGRLAPGRIEKGTKVMSFTHKRASGGVCRHDIYAYGSNYYLLALDAHGNETPIPLTPPNHKRAPNADGTVRWYHELEIPCMHGNQKALIPLFHDPRVNSSAFHIENRGEYFRFYPTCTSMFDYLYSRRNDTEALHNQIKRKLQRMPAYGVEAQSLFVLGITIAWNALERAFRLRRAGLPNALDDTN